MSRPIFPGLVLLLFCLACLPLSLSVRTGNFAEDERAYYLPSVARISAHWPAVDLIGDSTSATSPGYAYLLAGASKLTGRDPRVLRIVTIGVSAAALWILFLMFRAPRGWAACTAILPLAASNFFIKSAAWVVTDNAALLCSCAALLFLWKSPENPRCVIPAGLSSAAAIFTRQLHAWLIVPIGCIGIWKAPTQGPKSSRALAWIALVPPVAVALWIHHAWGGNVPPLWRSTHETGIHPASVACALSVFAALGIFYISSVEAPSGVLALARSRDAAIGAALGFIVAVIVQNGVNPAEGRWGGYFWLLVERAPSLWGRSVLVVAGSTAGGALAGAMARRLRLTCGSFTALLWLASVSSWVAACALNRLAFQRYFEPPILVFLISWLALLNIPDRQPGHASVRYRPLIALAVIQAAISLLTTFIPVLTA